jgi:hypothetical protein
VYRIVHKASFIKIVTIWLCVYISGWKLGERWDVRVGVLLWIG